MAETNKHAGFSEDPEWEGPDLLLEMAAKARPVCRKPKGHETTLNVEALERAMATHYGDEGWRLVLMSDDGGIVGTALPTALVEAIAREYTKEAER